MVARTYDRSSFPVGPRATLDAYGIVHVTGWDNHITTRPVTDDDRAAARQMTWFRSPASAPFRAPGRVVGGVRVKITPVSSTAGRYWLAVECSLKGAPVAAPTLIPRDADAGVWVASLIDRLERTCGDAPATCGLSSRPVTIHNGSRLCA